MCPNLGWEGWEKRKLAKQVDAWTVKVRCQHEVGHESGLADKANRNKNVQRSIGPLPSSSVLIQCKSEALLFSSEMLKRCKVTMQSHAVQ